MKTPKLVECASVPCRLPEDVARYVDGLVKDLPTDRAFAFRSKTLTDDVTTDEAERTDVSYISTPAIDRDKEVVSPDGMDLDQFRKNPVVLWGHDRSQIVGKALWVKQDGSNGVLAKTFYPARPDKHDGEWLPEQVWGLTRAGILKGKSVGILPLEIEEPDDELRNKGCELVLKRTLLLEYSCVSIPSCPDALVQQVKGLSLDALGVKRVGRVAPVKKTVTYRDRTADLCRLVEGFAIDPDAIAARVVDALKHRGRV